MSDDRLKIAPGFTLVEIQIAIFLVALIALLIGGALRLSAQTWARVADKQDVSEHQFFIARFLRSHLSDARFYSVSTESGERVFSFFGGENHMHFVAPFPAFMSSDELFWWTLREHQFSGQVDPSLVLEYMPFDAQDVVSFGADHQLIVSDKPSTQVVLEQHVTNFRISYFYETDGGQEEWLNDWAQERIYPIMVSLDLVAVFGLNHAVELDYKPLTIAFNFTGQEMTP